MNYYKILGIREGASTYEIITAYNAIKSFLSEQPERDEALVLEIEAAAQTLLNPYERAEYDKSLFLEGQANTPAYTPPQPREMIYVINNRTVAPELPQHASQYLWNFEDMTFLQKLHFYIGFAVLAFFGLYVVGMLLQMYFF